MKEEVRAWEREIRVIERDSKGREGGRGGGINMAQLVFHSSG